MNLPGEEEDLNEILEEDLRRKRILDRAENEVEKREARRLADAMERKDVRQPEWLSLTEQLERPQEEQVYSIDRILPLGGNALFAGRYKSGKTTFNGQLIKAWADGDLFLGQFRCYPDPERPVVTIFNYEMSEGQFHRWLRKVKIVNTDNVQVVHMRGMSQPFALPEIRAYMARRLRDVRTGLWIVDPASRAMAGLGDGNDNADVGMFVSWLDEIKMEAGVRDLVLNIHMGHAAAADKDAERAIGAQAWSAWADALWFLNKDKDDSRWFWADGRDVDVDRLLVDYNAETMGVKLVDTDPVRQRDNAIRGAVLSVIEQEPGHPWRYLRPNIARRASCRVTDADFMRDKLEVEGMIMQIHKGNHHKWYLANGAIRLPEEE